MLDLFEKKKEYHEEAVARRLGISRQTLRNWRVGYTNKLGTYPPKLTEGVEWRKLGNRKSKVVFAFGAKQVAGQHLTPLRIALTGRHAAVEPQALRQALDRGPRLRREHAGHALV